MTEYHQPFIIRSQHTYGIEMTHTPLEILYQDEQLVAVYKPEGLLVHRSHIDKHETQFLLQQLRNQIGQHVFPIHRLDKPTSGVIIFGLNPRIVPEIQQQMSSGTATKDYLLICRGYCPKSGIIDHPLKPIDDFKSKKAKVRTPKPPQEAITQYHRLKTVELTTAVDKYPTSRYSFVKARLITGRKHQIRRHFKHIAHPIIGCPKYGKSVHNHYFAEKLAAPRLLLHAYRLNITQPITGEAINITATPQGVFKDLLQRFQCELP